MGVLFAFGGYKTEHLSLKVRVGESLQVVSPSATWSRTLTFFILFFLISKQTDYKLKTSISHLLRIFKDCEFLIIKIFGFGK